MAGQGMTNDIFCPELSDNEISCPEFLDVKAFKGKGRAWAMLQAVRASFEECWAEMLRLSLESSHMNTRAYLQVHRYPGLARIPAVSSLRWRLKRSDRDAHTGWPQVEELVRGESVSVRRYYWTLNQRVLDLNCMAMLLQQTAIRLLLRLADRNARQAITADESRNGTGLFLAWVKGDISLADFDMRDEPFHTEGEERGLQ